MKKIVEISHMILQDYIGEDKIAIDFTLGHGNDTLYLQGCKEVYSFDIQKEAIEECQKLNLSDHVHLILDSHENFMNYVEHFDIGIFNFGYFPQGDQSITTVLEVSRKTVASALQQLNKKGILLLVCYIGHEEGKKEGNYFKEMAKKLNGHYFRTFLFEMQNTNQAPFIIGIEKIRNETKGEILCH